MISLLVPTRGRPEGFARMVRSAIDTAWSPDRVEVVAYQDADDQRYAEGWSDQTIVGERIVLSEMWNRCAEAARGNILMQCADDLVFRSEGWDAHIAKAFDACSDRIIFVHGDDGNQGDKLGTHGFLHRRWVDVLGYFVPPYFSSDYNDVWLTEVADALKRRVYVPEVFTDHLHYSFGKGVVDRTHQERLERHVRDDVRGKYERLAPERAADVTKLRDYIANYHRAP